YTVAAHADPSQVLWRYSPAEGVSRDEAGNLIIKVQSAGGDEPKLTESAPVAWQEIEGRRVAVAVGYRLLPEGTIGFSVGAYDPDRPLVIDPTLVYNRSFGGSVNELSHSIAVDSQGNAYVAGVTGSPDFPLVDPFQ